MYQDVEFGIYSVKCKGIPEFGLPFCAISDDAAIDMAKSAVKDIRDHLNMDQFVLMKVGTYCPDKTYPLYSEPDPCTIQEFADLDFKEEESE